MKKILCAILLFSVLVSTVHAITEAEKSTVSKLKNFSILEVDRNEIELLKPMKTIDILSMNIKTIRYLKLDADVKVMNLQSDMYAEIELLRSDFGNQLSIFDERIFPLESRQNAMEKRVIDLEYETDDIKKKVADADLKSVIAIALACILPLIF